MERSALVVYLIIANMSCNTSGSNCSISLSTTTRTGGDAVRYWVSIIAVLKKYPTHHQSLRYVGTMT